ncbi:MAG: hypothetical protein VYE27_07745 [Pseudomonadota bacterium]|nr:hypothetical protein [Pseudomonadota bacterium]
MSFFKNIFCLSLLVLSFYTPGNVVHAAVFLCRPWVNLGDGGDQFARASFTSKIENGTISFFGEQRPVAIATTIATHPIYDIFLAATGEVVVAAPVDDQKIKINIYFPNKNYTFFLKTFCNRT